MSTQTVGAITYRQLSGFRCFAPGCSHMFEELCAIPHGWQVTSKMVKNLATKNYALSYLCRCPEHLEQGAIGGFGQRMLDSIDPSVIEEVKIYRSAALCCGHEEKVLNPDAVAVKWFECALCGRTRNEVVKTEVW